MNCRIIVQPMTSGMNCRHFTSRDFVCNQSRMAGLDREITVVMPVYNALPFLDAAIASILGQTLTGFRLAIYDDHSDAP